jgi:soluble lytic murein transglycosylase-like protein
MWLVNKLASPLLWGLLLSLLVTKPGLANTPDIDEAFRDQLRQAIESADTFVDKFDAEVWLKDMSGRLSERASHIPRSERLDILTLVHREASRNNLSPQLVLAVIQVESNFDRFAISRAGAQGLMQVMPFWKNEIGHSDDNLFDPATNLRYGTAILRIYMERENQNIRTALARYHGSYPKDYYANRVVKAWQSRWLYR